jgi:hypothetical protein
LVQVEFLKLDKVNFSSKSEYELSVVLANVDQYLGKSEGERERPGRRSSIQLRKILQRRLLYRRTTTVPNTRDFGNFCYCFIMNEVWYNM